MFLAVGSGAYIAAIFHMVTHAFFKALLFLGAGSVIHGMHDEQDMKRMGALRKWMPITSGTFIVGWLAIAGVPPFSGFWSKDDILLGAWEKNRLLWLIGLVTALMTAYYMSRQVFLVFYGGERWKKATSAESRHDTDKTPAEAHAEPGHEPAATVGAAADHGAHGDFKPHESPPTMAYPLVVLAVLAAVAGILKTPLEHWLEPVLAHPHQFASSSGTKLGLILVTTVAGLAGVGIAYSIWLRKRVKEAAVEPEVLRRAWYVDELYRRIIEAPGRAIANFSAFVIDARVIDGTVNGVGALVRAGGSRLRTVQSGFVRNYALAVAVGAVAILAYAVARSA